MKFEDKSRIACYVIYIYVHSLIPSEEEAPIKYLRQFTFIFAGKLSFIKCKRLVYYIHAYKINHMLHRVSV